MRDREQADEHVHEQIRHENECLLLDFEEWLAGRGLSEKTRHRHRVNIELYINHFLLYNDAVAAASGASHVSMFLGYWFIRKALWASEAALRHNATSMKKFYTFLNEKGLVTEEEVNALHASIKEELPEWLATMRRYENPSITDPAVIWGLPEYP